MSFRHPFDNNRNARFWCKLGLVVSWIVGMTAIIGGAAAIYVTQHTGAISFGLSSTVREVLPLLINLIVTLLNDSMGYIHACSLRWSLQREGKLDFNSNLRLLTCARHSPPNAWYSNVVYLSGIVLAYSSPSLIFLSLNPGLAAVLGHAVEEPAGADKADPSSIHLNPFALLLFGVGLVLQALISTWALTTTIPTWSANPFDVVRACMDPDITAGGYRVRYRPGRCMMGVHMAHEDRASLHPSKRQRPMITAHGSVRYVYALLVALPVATGGWGGIAYAMILRGDRNGVLGRSWALLPWFTGSAETASCDSILSGTKPYACTEGTPLLNVGWSGSVAGSVGSVFYIALFQAALALALHCAELLVNLSRDEAVFRQLLSRRGTNGRTNSVLAALTAWQTLVLFAFKAAVHWLFGLALNVSYNVGIIMYPPQIFYLSGLALAVALFGTVLALQRHSGYLPSAFGHIQTIADLVDEWVDSGCMFWGHKADGKAPGEPCYAGTSANRLKPVRPTCEYGGMPQLTRDEMMYQIGYAQGASRHSLVQNPHPHQQQYRQGQQWRAQARWGRTPSDDTTPFLRPVYDSPSASSSHLL